MTPDRIAERKAKMAIWVREGLVKLGPTFIKIGQQFSTRVDVLSPEFVKELEKLQVGIGAAVALHHLQCCCMPLHDAYMQGKIVQLGVVSVLEQEAMTTPALHTCSSAAAYCSESWCVSWPCQNV